MPNLASYRAWAVCLLLCGVPAPALGGEGERGIKLGAVYTGDTGGVVSGGEERGFVHLGTVELTLSADLEKRTGWTGATLFLHGLGAYGDRPSSLAGDVQVLDNIAARTIPWELYQAWIEQVLFDHRLSLLVGYYAVDSEFDLARSTQFFIQSGLGTGTVLGNSGRNGPSIFPVTSFGARLLVLPADELYIAAAVLDGIASDVGGPNGTHFFPGGHLLVVCEMGWVFALPGRSGIARRRYVKQQVEATYRVKVAAGGWLYSSGLARVSASSNAPTRFDLWGGGVYLLADALTYRERPGSDQGLWLSARGQMGRPLVDGFPYFFSFAASYLGLFPGRDDDELGLGAGIAVIGEPLRRARQLVGQQSGTAEANLELTYRALIASWLFVQADLQYIIGPNADPTLPNALALLLRLQLKVGS